MDRFIVEKQQSGAFMVKDTKADVYKSGPVMAVAIYFKTLLRAQTVCNILNAEWSEFERNPS